MHQHLQILITFWRTFCPYHRWKANKIPTWSFRIASRATRDQQQCVCQLFIVLCISYQWINIRAVSISVNQCDYTVSYGSMPLKSDNHK